MARRKAEMILDLVDRVTRPAMRIMRIMKRMGAAARSSNSIGGRAARAYAAAQTSLQGKLHRTNQLIARQTEKLRQSAAVMGKGLSGVASGAMLGIAALTGLAASGGAAGVALLGPAREFERFQSILTTTEGSATAAKEAMAWVEGFAVKTPYELDQVMEAFVQLRAYGLDPTNGMLETLGNTSAAMGKPLMQSVEAIADAVNGENERLKEFGIKASKERGVITYQYTDAEGVTRFAKAAADNKAAIEATLLDIMSKYDGAMVNMSQTFDGMASNVMDLWSKFQRMTMSAGVFDWMKGKLRLLLDTLDQMAASGELSAWAERISEQIIWSLELLWSFGLRIQDVWRSVFPYLESAAGLMGGWENLLLSLLAIPFRGVIIAAVMGLGQLAAGALMASRAMLALGGTGTLAGILRLSSGILGLLNPLNWVKAAVIGLRVALISTGIGALVVGLALAGLWIYNNWSGLLEFFTAFGVAFWEALGPAAPLVESLVSPLQAVARWVRQITGPLDASGERWKQWGRAAGEAVGYALSSISSLFDWLKSPSTFSWSSVIGPIDWMKLSGGIFALATLIKPIKWTAKLIGGPILWAFLLGRFALAGLLKPVVWTARLVSRVPWLKLAGGGAKFAMNALLAPLAWTSKLVGKLPWLKLAGGGKKFALKGLLTALKWGARLIPGIGWAALAGELAWHLLIKRIDWSRFSWLKFEWKDILPKWDWSSLIPGLKTVDIAIEARASVVPSGSVDVSQLSDKQQKILNRHEAWRQKTHGHTANVQARVRGGSYSPGWLLTGEGGPELKYESQRGYVAHNLALRRMSQAARAAALSAAVAAPSFADELKPASGQQYLSAKAPASAPVNAQFTLNVQGNVDKDVMPELKAAIEQAKRELIAELRERDRAAKRKEHS